MTPPVIPPSPSREEYARDYAAALAVNGDETIFDRVEPIGLFVEWLAEAGAHEVNDSNAMTLSTVDADGMPDARIVLLKDVDGRGFTFYSNRESAKGLELDARPVAALTFHWKSLRRQVRVRQPRPREPGRGLGLGPVSSAGHACDAGRRRGARDRPVRRRRGAAPRTLDRLACDAAKRRILARPSIPPARPAALHARRRRLEPRTPLALMSRPFGANETLWLRPR